MFLLLLILSFCVFTVRSVFSVLLLIKHTCFQNRDNTECVWPSTPLARANHRLFSHTFVDKREIVWRTIINKKGRKINKQYGFTVRIIACFFWKQFSSQLHSCHICLWIFNPNFFFFLASWRINFHLIYPDGTRWANTQNTQPHFNTHVAGAVRARKLSQPHTRPEL